MTQKSLFDEFKQIDKEGNEYWSARELFKLLDYQKWDKFLIVIQKAKEACKLSGFNEIDHFPHMEKMVELGSGAKREIGENA